MEEEDGAEGGMCEVDQVGLTVRLLIGAFIPRSQRGGEANQRETRDPKSGVS